MIALVLIPAFMLTCRAFCQRLLSCGMAVRAPACGSQWDPRRVSDKGQDDNRGSLTPTFFVFLSFSAPQESQLGTRHFATCMTQPGGRGTRNALRLRNRCWPGSSLGAEGPVGASRPYHFTKLPFGPNSAILPLMGILCGHPALLGGCSVHLGPVDQPRPDPYRLGEKG